MTEHSESSTPAGLHDLLSGAAGDFFPGTAPYDAIVGDARRRIRLRAAGGSALSLVAIGAAVAVGTSSFGGAAGHVSDRTPAQSVAAAAGGTPVAPPATTTTTAAVNADHYGKVIVAQGDFDGTHWTLTRDLNLQENVAMPGAPGKDAKPVKGPWAFDDVYVTGPNGLRDRAAGGGSTAPGHLAELLNHFGRPDADAAASVTFTTLGTGAMDDSWNKEKASPYGISFLSGIVSSKVARVQAVFADGTSQDTKLVAAPAGEDGQYFYLPFKSTSRQFSGHIVLYDGQGHILRSRVSQF
jgi:hypothetical protein